MKETLIDKRLLEEIFSDQKEELSNWTESNFCSRAEERLVDLDSQQAQ